MNDTSFLAGHSTKYGILKNDKTAVIEMAQAAGITLLKDEKLNPMIATTYGVGEMILDAIERGCRNFIIGIGGSATTDGGVGMLQALGYEFIDKNGISIGPGVEHLDEIEYISEKKVNKIIKKCHFQVACDVKNPLLNDTSFLAGHSTTAFSNKSSFHS